MHLEYVSGMITVSAGDTITVYLHNHNDVQKESSSMGATLREARSPYRATIVGGARSRKRRSHRVSS